MSDATVMTGGPRGWDDGGLGDDDVRWITAIERWTDFLLAAGYTTRTIEQRRYQLRRLWEANLARSPWRVTTEQLITWMAGQEWAPESRRSYRAALTTFYAWGVQAGHTRRNPAADLPPVRVPPAAPRPTPDEVTVVAFGSTSDRDRLILYLAAYAGLRRAEIAGLMWADIAGGSIRIRGKGGRVRVVPMHPQLARELADERARRERGQYGTGYRYRTCHCGCVFPGQAGGPMTPNAIGRAASRALGAGYGAHGLRHWFATRAYASTRDLFAVQTLLGHAKPETTRRYTELGDDALAAAVNGI